VLSARDAALGHEQALCAHHALHALAVEDPARGARAAQAPTNHRRHPARPEPRPIAADIKDVRLDHEIVSQRRPAIAPRPAHDHAVIDDGLDGLDGRAMVERLAADAQQAGDQRLRP